MGSEAAVADQKPEEQRKTPRTTLPSIDFGIDGTIYEVADWSLGGCRIRGYEGDLEPGSTAAASIFLHGQHEHFGLSVNVEVVRRDVEDNTLAVRFMDLHASDIMEYCGEIERAMTESAGD